VNSWWKACRRAVFVLNWTTGTAELLVSEDCWVDGRMVGFLWWIGTHAVTRGLRS